jgi:hypothetical protein
MRRDRVRSLAPMLALFSVLLFLISPPSRAPFWTGLFILPVFLIGTALAVPAFSAFELAMPVTRTELLWSRILASLGLVWLSVLTGVATMLLLLEEPLADARQPVEFAVFFTASACLATSARVSPRPTAERILWLSALLCGFLALRSVPWQAALGIAGVAALPILAKLWWTYVPEWDRRTTASVVPIESSVWLLLKLLCSWQTFAVAPLAFLVGRNLSWTCLPFAAMFLTTVSARQRYLLGLPVSRRYLLLARLLPALALLLAGVAYGYRAGHLNWTPPSTPLAGSSDWRSYSGNPPGIDVPWDYYRRLQSSPPPEIVAPWGETAQPQSQPFFQMFGPPLHAFNPYSVKPKNSGRFFEWQFGRATQAIYGKALRPEELPAALRAGLKPLTEQARMEILTMAFGAASLLALALLSAMSQWHYLRHIPNSLRTLLKPLGLPFVGMFALTFFISAVSASFDPVAARVQPLLLHLSAILPANLAWMTLVLLAALGPFYWALETVFNKVEFPDKPKETK